MSLLPNDPPPFTIPEAQGRRSAQPDVSLADYPLPDGTWRWVSSTWMIDMRDDGDVSYDGFEYNWFFRRQHWHPDVGKFGLGGWVRRRRWVRLMTRPGNLHERAVLAATNPTSPSSDNGHTPTPIPRVWMGDGDDWKRCHLLMRRLDRDGKRLELWKEWLDASTLQHASPVKKWSEDEQPLPSAIARGEDYAWQLEMRSKDELPRAEWIGRVVCEHVS